MPADAFKAPVRVSAGDSYAVEAAAAWVGGDLLVWMWGGDRPHIGAVAAAHPRPSLANPSQRSATASVLVFSGHREDAIAKSAAERLASVLGVNTVVTAGLHWDSVSPEGIERARVNAEGATETLLREFAAQAKLRG